MHEPITEEAVKGTLKALDKYQDYLGEKFQIYREFFYKIEQEEEYKKPIYLLKNRDYHLYSKFLAFFAEYEKEIKLADEFLTLSKAEELIHSG